MIVSKLIDKKNRQIDYLRLSVTDRCNLGCIYCTPIIRNLKHKYCNILSYEELLRIVRIAVKLGIKKVRVTGGEPLVRKGIFNFIKNLSKFTEINDLSLTTNGVLLYKNVKNIITSGIKRINVSLDSLISKKYEYITGKDKFRTVWDGIILASKEGINPIKLNIVAMRGLNDDEFSNFAALTFEHPFHIRFIEYMPIGITREKIKYQILSPEIKKKISKLGVLNPIKNNKNDGPAKRFKFNGAIGEIGFITALSKHFCHDCNRIRLTADGKLRPCLLSDYTIPLKSLVGKKISEKKIAEFFFVATKYKDKRHSIIPNGNRIVQGSMHTIGG